MKKKGDIWVSAVLYIALGMVVITLILSAGLPLISKMRDRNTIAQTKRVMFDIDNNIKAVANEAKGSTRFLSPVDISSGELYIDQDGSNMTVWGMKTKNKLMETGTQFSEGDLQMEIDETATEGEYEMKLRLDYNGKVDLSLAGDYENPFQGRYSFSIKNNGYPSGCIDCPVNVMITVT